MIKLIKVPVMSEAVKKAGDMVKKNHEAGRKTLVFCDDALYIDVERVACEACGGGMFEPFVYTFSSFLGEYDDDEGVVLSRYDSVTIMARIMQDYINIKKLSCFKTAEVAGDVYDAVSMLYSSHVDVKNLAEKKFTDDLLEKKLNDICFLYGKYFEFLEANGYRDRNTRLSDLPKVVKGSGAVDEDTDVIFAGFRTFSWFESRVLTVCMSDACNVYGILPGGRGEFSEKFFRPVYTDESADIFRECVKKTGRGDDLLTEEWDSVSPPEAGRIVSGLYNGLTFKEDYLDTDCVHLFEAADAEEEMRYVAANIERLTRNRGARYRDIAVMMPDVENRKPLLSRVFSEYGIPFFTDGKLPLTDCPVCSFITDIMSCGVENYSPDFVDAAVSNPLFDFFDVDLTDNGEDAGDVTLGAAEDTAAPGAARFFPKWKNEFRNYVLLFANYRGGILAAAECKDADKASCVKAGIEYDGISEVRKKLISLVNMVSGADSKKRLPSEYYDAVCGILESVDAEEKLKKISRRYAGECRPKSVLYGKAYGECLSVVRKICDILGDRRIDASEFLKILKGAFSSDKVSVTGRRFDEVFVGDISDTVNPGSAYLFAAGMTNAVPRTLEDTSLLTEKDLEEIVRLEGDGKDGDAPDGKIRFPDMNARYRETAGLNVASFGKEIYLSYPLREEGRDDTVPCEIVSYFATMFSDVSAGFSDGVGKDLEAADMGKAREDREFLASMSSRRTSAYRLMLTGGESERRTAEEFLRSMGEDVDCFKKSLEKEGKENLPSGDDIFTNAAEHAVATTTLEAWFGCPYRAFMEKGLGVSKRKTSRDLAPDMGSFVHSVLEKVFSEMKYGPEDKELVLKNAEKNIGELLAEPAFVTIANQRSGAGRHAVSQLVEEVKKICLGVYGQLMNSDFEVNETETSRIIDFLDGGRVKGKIDRVDVAEPEGEDAMVRVIDYKTGFICKDSAEMKRKYYMGQKLQLELYLSAVSEGKTSAGSYYFPASVTYGKKGDNGEKFPLVGFMDGDASVVRASDKSLKEGQSQYVGTAKLVDKPYDEMSMEGKRFSDFLKYGIFVAKSGVEEMRDGFIQPTPVKNGCKGCSYSGLCGYDKKSDVPERCLDTPKSDAVAQIAADKMAELEPGKKLFEVFKVSETRYENKAADDDDEYDDEYDDEEWEDDDV